MAPKRRSVAGNCALEGWERSLCRVGEVDAIASFIKYGLQFPVPFLYEEFAKQRRGKVYTFQDLASALQHYKTNADSKLDLPSQEELDLAKKEQRSLSNKSQCNCLDGPSPIGGYENRFYIVRCQKCGVILGMQEDYYSYSD